MIDKKISWLILLGVLLLFGLYRISLYSYLLFHSLAEIFSIVVACGIFMLAWNSRRFLDNAYLLFLGIAYFFIGGLDLIHTLAYRGMGVFEGYGANLPTQLWIAARYVESLSLLIAPLILGRKLKIRLLFLAYSLVFLVLLGSIFHWNLFPFCFVEGIGLTPFKKISEYIISLILLGSIAMLLRKGREFDLSVLRLLIASIALTIGSELAFTFYIHAYGLSNLVGHYLKIISFYLIYKAIIETGLTKPYSLLFRNLKQSEEALRDSEGRFRAITEAIPVPVMISRKSDSVILYANEHFEKLVGLPSDQLIGRKTLDFFYDLSDRQGIRDTLQREGFVSTYEFRAKRADGAPFWVITSSQPLMYKGEQAYLSGFHDVTEQREAEDQIIRAKREWELTFDAVPDLIMILDNEYRVVRANKAMANRLG
ncbi:MAG: PAS domain S-box protein, partial [Candidatus Hydrogenedentota bacterium]